MLNPIDIDFLQYLKDHQNTRFNYMNRYFVLEGQLKEKYKESEITLTRSQLVKRGYVDESSTGLIYLTKKGTKQLQETYQEKFLGVRKKIFRWLNLNTIGAVGLIFTIIFGCCNWYYNTHKGIQESSNEILIMNTDRSIST